VGSARLPLVKLAETRIGLGAWLVSVVLVRPAGAAENMLRTDVVSAASVGAGKNGAGGETMTAAGTGISEAGAKTVTRSWSGSPAAESGLPPPDLYRDSSVCSLTVSVDNWAFSISNWAAL